MFVFGAPVPGVALAYPFKYYIYVYVRSSAVDGTKKSKRLAIAFAFFISY